MNPGDTNHDFGAAIARCGLGARPTSLRTLQLNITRMCNQACTHCHVDASPRRREIMPDPVLDRCVEILARTPAIATVDITGGAPELHPRFRDLVIAARQLGKHVIVRHNLTVSLDPHPLEGTPMHWVPEFFAAQAVEVVSSLPCYGSENTDRQRGMGVFHKSIASLQSLNALGYGRAGSGRVLNLVYNPGGAFLPPAQVTLEADYKRRLAADHGISFNNLFVMTNVPIKRFRAQLQREGRLGEYMDLLSRAFNPAAAAFVMCRDMLSVAWDGSLYDCDFNQILGLRLQGDAPPNVASWEPEATAALLGRELHWGPHCFACTAGAGSSCGGAVLKAAPDHLA